MCSAHHWFALPGNRRPLQSVLYEFECPVLSAESLISPIDESEQVEFSTPGSVTIVPHIAGYVGRDFAKREALSYIASGY